MNFRKIVNSALILPALLLAGCEPEPGPGPQPTPTSTAPAVSQFTVRLTRAQGQVAGIPVVFQDESTNTVLADTVSDSTGLATTGEITGSFPSGVTVTVKNELFQVGGGPTSLLSFRGLQSQQEYSIQLGSLTSISSTQPAPTTLEVSITQPFSGATYYDVTLFGAKREPFLVRLFPPTLTQAIDMDPGFFNADGTSTTLIITAGVTRPDGTDQVLGFQILNARGIQPGQTTQINNALNWSDITNLPEVTLSATGAPAGFLVSRVSATIDSFRDPFGLPGIRGETQTVQTNLPADFKFRLLTGISSRFRALWQADSRQAQYLLRYQFLSNPTQQLNWTISDSATTLLSDLVLSSQNVGSGSNAREKLDLVWNTSQSSAYATADAVLGAISYENALLGNTFHYFFDSPQNVSDQNSLTAPPLMGAFAPLQVGSLAKPLAIYLLNYSTLSGYAAFLRDENSSIFETTLRSSAQGILDITGFASP